MSALTAAFDIGMKPGNEVAVLAAAVICYRGGAAAVIAGVGYATPLVPATAGTNFIGIYQQTLDNSAGTAGGVRVDVAQTGLFAFNVSGSIVQGNVGQKVYFVDDNTVTLTYSANAIEAGYVDTIDTAGVVWIRIDQAVYQIGKGGYNQAIVADGATLTNSTVETSMGAITIAGANTLKAGDRIRFTAQVKCPATNSTDTLNVKAYLGSIASGTNLAATGALDVANNDIAVITGELTIRATGAGTNGSFTACGLANIGTPGTATTRAFAVDATAVDTTLAFTLTISGTWSVANAGDQAILKILESEVVRS